MALTLAGWIETMCGNQAEGRAMVERAHRLNPRDPRGWLMSGAMAIAAVVDEDYADALRWAERALAQNQRFAVALRVMAVASVKLGQINRARQAVQALLEIEPGLTVSGFFARIPVPLESMARAVRGGAEGGRITGVARAYAGRCLGYAFLSPISSTLSPPTTRPSRLCVIFTSAFPCGSVPTSENVR